MVGLFGVLMILAFLLLRPGYGKDGQFHFRYYGNRELGRHFAGAVFEVHGAQVERRAIGWHSTEFCILK